MAIKSKIIVAIAVIGIAVIGGICYWQNNNNVVQAPIEIKKNEKTYQGNGFSFVYPIKYTADNKGLWTAEGYQRHINPPEACDMCQIPEIEVKAAETNQTLDQQIISDFSLSGKTLEEMSLKTGINYSKVKIGNNDFIKITVRDMFDVTGYYTKHQNRIVAFNVFNGENDNEELRNILSTLKFN
jgi:hypothetical protein